MIPIFPLPSVVLFPYMPLPLHIFEPRYRAMVHDAARGSRLIGMVLLRGGAERPGPDAPAVFPVGTIGEMVRCEALPDGRLDIVLRGMREYVIEREVDRGTDYRHAAVACREPLRGPLAPGIRESVLDMVRRYLGRLGRAADGTFFSRDVGDEVVVNFFAQHLDLDPLEKQALLEAPTLALRAARLHDVLEFALEQRSGHPGTPSQRPH